MTGTFDVCSAVFAGGVAAQPVAVTGTGDPDVDVPAVHAAIDQGGSVVLMGHFFRQATDHTRRGNL